MSVNERETRDTQSTDRIEKQLVLRATRSRVWRAITTPEEFGAWFRMNIDGAFAEGATVLGRVTHPGYEHACPVEMTIERMEAERYSSYRWHPYALDAAVDYSVEPTTLVEFILQDADGGTDLMIVESGFDGIPHARRAEAFRMNDNGWGGQMKYLERYVA